jgi:hypothetical protein
MRDLSESTKQKLMAEATAEFPADVMMREIHCVRPVQYHQTKDLSAIERVCFYRQAKKRVATSKRRKVKKVATR